MLVSPKWQTMWLESQHCSKSIMSVPLASQQAKKVLEDLRTSCCSPNKRVQLEALKCWGMWINSQNSDDWKLNTVCFTAVRPLLTKKMQPLHRDADICKLKLSLMWALLVKVENIMQLEGPQYILEVFLQSCLSWLSSVSGDGCENEVSLLIFQLLLSLLKKSETVNGCEKDMFDPLTTDILHAKKVFYRLADKFLNIFIHWRKVPDKSMFFKLWKHFLEHCELSCEHIPIPLWHKVFKLADQICSEKNEPIKERLAFLHSCATTLNSALSSSKFIDFGNLMTTPCEALFKKLVELCTIKCTELCDSEMFVYSKEICQTLSDKSVAIGGFDLCIHVLDLLEEFWLKELLWGVWCGLVHCYKIHLQRLDRNQFTEVQMKFYRKLRGVAVNFELDRDALHKDCISEVEKHIELLNINCFCLRKSETPTVEDSCAIGKEVAAAEPMELDSENSPESLSRRIVRSAPLNGNFSTVALYKRRKVVPRTIDNLKIDLIKHILTNIDANCKKSLFNYLLSFQFMKGSQPMCRLPASFSLQLKVGNKEEMNLTVSCLEPKALSPAPPSTPVKKNAVVPYERHREAETDQEDGEEMISTPKTRSRRRAEEEMKKEMERQRRKKRKSFEVLVQEIVRKNKERKTEKNSRRKSPVLVKGKRNKKKMEKAQKENKIEEKKKEEEEMKPEVCERKLRHTKKEEPKNEKKKGGKSFKTDGKLENYFKVITKKSGSEVRNVEKKPRKGKKEKEGKRESSCCNTEKEESGERRGEIGWRQTSLKTMMNRKNKGDKNKPELRSRSKSAEAGEEKGKGKKGSKVTDSPLSKLSPFKEVFHDHEYAKIELEQLQTFERVLLVKQERVSEVKKTEKANGEEGLGSGKDQKTKKRKPDPVDLSPEIVTEPSKTEVKNSESENVAELGKEDCKITEVEAPRIPEELSCPREESEKQEAPVKPDLVEEPTRMETSKSDIPLEQVADGDVNKPKLQLPEEVAEDQPANDIITLEETSEEVPTDSLLTKRGRKRVRMLDSLKPSKKMKLEEEDGEEEKLPLEVTEKENLEERQLKLSSPAKKDKGGSCALGRGIGEDSPRTGSGMISSRALRMIALVPESTKGSQMQWESTPRMEGLKCKKAPNVDKNSRASRMLALLSESVGELEEEDDLKVEEGSSRKGGTPLTTTPNVKTPVSSLKSPRSIKKRRSIRFDDSKNETVLYKTDTPPSQILEEKEKCRRLKPAES